MLAASTACTSLEARVIVSGRPASFAGSAVVNMLVENSCITDATELDFLESVKLHGIPMRRESNVLFEGKVYSVQRLVRASADEHYAMLHEIAPHVSVDMLGAYYVFVHADVYSAPQRLVALGNSIELSCLWTFSGIDSSLLYIVPRF